MAGRVGGLTAGPHNKEKLNNVRALTSEEARYRGCHNMFRSGLILTKKTVMEAKICFTVFMGLIRDSNMIYQGK